MAQYIQKPRGTMDVFPEEAAYWQKIERTARDVAARFGFGEIKTPTFEDINLFRRGVGEVTDVVQKEMYTFTDKDNRTFALRHGLVVVGDVGNGLPVLEVVELAKLQTHLGRIPPESLEIRGLELGIVLFKKVGHFGRVNLASLDG